MQLHAEGNEVNADGETRRASINKRRSSVRRLNAPLVDAISLTDQEVGLDMSEVELQELDDSNELQCQDVTSLDDVRVGDEETPKDATIGFKSHLSRNLIEALADDVLSPLTSEDEVMQQQRLALKERQLHAILDALESDMKEEEREAALEDMYHSPELAAVLSRRLLVAPTDALCTWLHSYATSDVTGKRLFALQFLPVLLFVLTSRTTSRIPGVMACLQGIVEHTRSKAHRETVNDGSKRPGGAFNAAHSHHHPSLRKNNGGCLPLRHIPSHSNAALFHNARTPDLSQPSIYHKPPPSAKLAPAHTVVSDNSSESVDERSWPMLSDVPFCNTSDVVRVCVKLYMHYLPCVPLASQKFFCILVAVLSSLGQGGGRVMRLSKDDVAGVEWHCADVDQPPLNGAPAFEHTICDVDADLLLLLVQGLAFCSSWPDTAILARAALEKVHGCAVRELHESVLLATMSLADRFSPPSQSTAQCH